MNETKKNEFLLGFSEREQEAPESPFTDQGEKRKLSRHLKAALDAVEKMGKDLLH